MQSKDPILVPLVTIGHHQLLEKEKWERMIGKVTQETRGRCENTNSKHTACRYAPGIQVMGALFIGRHATYTYSKFTRTANVQCAHTTHNRGAFCTQGNLALTNTPVHI